MRILVTGANGLVGRNICDLLATTHHEVISGSRAACDLLDSRAVHAYVSDLRPDMVVHCAGRVGGIAANMKEPAAFLADNIMMGVHVVQAAAKAGVPRLINLGSSCMYPAGFSEPLREEQLLSGVLEPTNEGYAIAKLAVMRLCEYVTRTTDVQYKTMVPCNLYGRYDHFDAERSHLVPAILLKLQKAIVSGASSIEVWGDGTARREFMDAADLAHCILYALDHFESMPTVVNVGLGTDRTIREYYEAACTAVGFTGTLTFDTSKPVGMRRKLLDVSRATAWGWTAKIPLTTGLAAAWAYLQETTGA